MVSELQNSMDFTADSQEVNASSLSVNGNSKWLTPMKLELTVKLNHNNFLLWRQQVLAAIRGNRLSSFIDCPVQPPNRLNLDKSVNEAYLDWEQQDQALLCWILSSISQEILPQLVGCSTANLEEK
ncbi:hypothetical protein Ddye_006058 [Dipteronia dyeriana]|uniref:Retrotransposon Copia-like N-terminal domain-containing protein n=1 Tax=Dipteronia dyeriana TaxID=168575 RepID=A0AAD9XHM2_9ROSI|nr:hypothetical protein Ddye_006058 [Dipteronia dyeriana]